MAKSKEAFRTISEVADWLETQPHVLRFWESKFTQVRPVKRAGGRRYYRPADMRLIGGIKKLLHDDGMTIKGVQKLLREQGIKEISALSRPLTAKPGETLDLTATEVPEKTIKKDDVVAEVHQEIEAADPVVSVESKPVTAIEPEVSLPDAGLAQEMRTSEATSEAPEQTQMDSPQHSPVDPIVPSTPSRSATKPASKAIPRKPMFDDISGWDIRRKLLASLVKIDHVPDENHREISNAILQLKSLQNRLEELHAK
ncbi:MAG: MerR family transcriptional regulator [Cognatishimia sp.]